MKAIAEYFRDLAADDRYFGAEPPTPDADMLARIAEREIERRVEAHQEQGKIVLRAEEAPALATSAVVADAALDVAEEEASETDAVADDAAPETDVAADENISEDAAPAEDEMIEEDAAPEEMAAEDDETSLVSQTLRAAEEEPAEIDEPADLAQELDDIEPEAVAEIEFDDGVDVPALDAQAEDSAAVDAYPSIGSAWEETPETDAPAADEASVDMAAMDDAEEEEDQHIETEEEFFQNSPAVDASQTYETEEADTPVAEPDSVAAKLSAIRSVVSQSEDAYQTDDYSEDEHAQDFLNETAAELDAALALDDENEPVAEPAQNDLSEGTAEDVLLDDSVGDVEEDTETLSDDAAEDADTNDGFNDTLSQLLADSVVEDDADAPETAEFAAEEDAETEADYFADLTADTDVEDVASEEAAQEDDEDDEDTSHVPVNARVIKMTSDEFEAALGEDETSGDEAEAHDAISAETEMEAPSDEDVSEDAILSPEQEEELQRELAEVEADLEMDNSADAEEESADLSEEVEMSDADADPEAEIEPTSAREGRHKFDAADNTSDIERIFDEADNQLEKPESNQRRSAIQHLRAAVAATRAEKKAGNELHKDVDDTPYRSDLASVVRPRRPNAAEGTRSERPVETRPAPLKLVAEQRVDTDQAPIRPRRVSAATEAMPQTEATSDDGSSNFSEYARQMGATQLPDLLEAAAAYMSDVEGRAQFSRPMLMHKLQEVEKENFSREDGLRSFGKLLREGKIQKIKGGRFTVTDETEFRDDARHAG